MAKYMPAYGMMLIFSAALVVCNKKLRRYLNVPGTTEKNTRGRPEIDRLQLRQFLLQSLEEGTIKWNSRLRSVEEANGKISLHFDRGTVTGFDLVVGADGAWSKVRPLVSDAEPIYTGISGWQFSILNPQEHHPDLFALVNRGSLFAFSTGNAIIAQQMGNGSIGVGRWKVLPEDWQTKAKFDVRSGEAVRDALLDEYQDWAPELRTIIEVMDTSHIMSRNLYMLPVGHKWTHKPGVTLLGDAAHLMSPFAGEGVNLAMKDALDLSEAIIEAVKSGDKASLDGQVQKSEEAMFRRSKRVQQLTYDIMSSMFFTPGAPDTCIETCICQAVTSEMNPILGTTMSVLVYVYYFFFRLFGWGGGHK